MSLNEARKNLEACLGDEFKKEYFALLRQWFMFSAPITKEEFDRRPKSTLVPDPQMYDLFKKELFLKVLIFLNMRHHVVLLHYLHQTLRAGMLRQNDYIIHGLRVYDQAVRRIDKR
ncbi:hypothetical protein NQ318_001346 [Aromia moschata]|uniref:Uncharacterized protein n=1 Tax=Aromia moschata TaxID=1265417 RepID=A0AAV8XS96_9CUCU|nr:hypothetical protein NQ318_001346 [Aromia moschata]